MRSTTGIIVLAMLIATAIEAVSVLHVCLWPRKGWLTEVYYDSHRDIRWVEARAFGVRTAYLIIDGGKPHGIDYLVPGEFKERETPSHVAAALNETLRRDPGFNGTWTIDTVGLPLGAMAEVYENPDTGRAAVRHAADVTLPWGQVITVPLKPVWSHLLPELLLWGGMAGGVLYALRWRKALARVRRGRCVQCEYPRAVGFNGRCPECGHQPSVRWLARHDRSTE